jgi:sigma-E factor negative regulatory protein RseB
VSRSIIAVIVAAALLFSLAVGCAAWGAAAPPDDGESEDTGLPLLREAALAGRTQEYTGRQTVTTWGPAGPISSFVSVANRPGSGLTVDPEPGTAERVDPGSPAGGLSAPPEGMLEVLARNYRIVGAGKGSVCGRESLLVAALRPDGTPAARFWIDKASRLVLRREILDSQGDITHVGAFVDITLPHPRRPPRLLSSQRPVDLDVRGLDRLRQRGWQFPTTLPGQLELFTASDATPGYLYLGYSDGLSVVSVFVQHGRLDEEHLAGWHVQVRGGHTIWSRDSAGQETIWASGGHVYTVVADAPADLVDAVVASLPHEGDSGFWARMGRGAGRVLSWINPFG